MGFFQEIDEQYFVEEISYDDMMLILEHQKHEHESNSLSDKLLQNQADKFPEQHLEVGTAFTFSQQVPALSEPQVIPSHVHNFPWHRS